MIPLLSNISFSLLSEHVTVTKIKLRLDPSRFQSELTEPAALSPAALLAVMTHWVRRSWLRTRRDICICTAACCPDPLLFRVCRAFPSLLSGPGAEAQTRRCSTFLCSTTDAAVSAAHDNKDRDCVVSCCALHFFLKGKDLETILKKKQ